MTGTTLSTYGTLGILITNPDANPVLVTSEGTIVTTGDYAIFDDTSTPGQVTNYGMLEDTASSGIGVEFANAGTLSNFGAVSATGKSGIGVQLTNGGTVNNGSSSSLGGSIHGAFDGVLMKNNSGTVENYGTITGTGGNGVEMDNGYGGSDIVQNGSSGTLSSYLINGGKDGVLLNGPGTLNNYGSIVGKTGHGVYVGGAAIVNNGDASDLGRRISGMTGGVEISSGSIANFGIISATGTASAAAQLVNGGTLTNGSAAVTGRLITGGSDGVLMNNSSGTVQNFGTITGAAGNGIEMDNGYGGSDIVQNGISGKLTSFLISGGADGVLLNGPGTLNNYGSIVGKTGHGAYIGGAATVNNGDAANLGRSISGMTGGVEISSGSIANFGTISATGTASAAAQLVNGGTLTNGSAAVTGRLIAGASDGVFMNNSSGTVENFGTITGAAGNGIEMDNGYGGSDVVQNGSSGTLSSFLISGGADGVYLNGPATVSNYGSILGNTGKGVYVGGAATVDNGDSTDLGRRISGVTGGVEIGSGTIANFGTISATGTASAAAQLVNGGTLTNGSAAVTGRFITGGGEGVFMNNSSGTVENFGTITGGAGNGIEMDNGYGGSDVVQNGSSGKLSSFLISGGEDGIFLNGPGTLNNYGSIVGKTGRGAYVDGAATVNNGDATDLGRRISGTTGGVEISSGSIANFGIISATGTASAAAQLVNGGTLANGSAAVTGRLITGGSDGVLMNNSSGTVENFGTIMGAAGNGVEMDNGYGGSDVVQNGSSGKLSGFLISGGGDGVFLNGPGTLNNYGSIVGKTGHGAYIGGAATVNNGDAADLGRSISGMTGGVEISSGSIANFGTISATGTASIAAQLVNGGTLTNGSAAITGGLITGGSDGVLMNNSSGTVENFGTITGAAGNGIEMDNGYGGSDIVQNGSSGTIAGKVGILVGNTATITNAGTITGTGGTAIQFGGGNDTLILDSGSVLNGIVNGGGGTNTLELGAGTGTLGLIGSEFVNFTGLGVDAGASWTLSGSNTISLSLNDGDINLSASATLSIIGSINADSSGVFNLGLNSTLSVAADLGSQDRMNFLASATLDVDNASMFGTQAAGSYSGPEIEGFTLGDMIDLKNVNAAGTTLDYTAGTGLLDIISGTTTLATLFFQGSTLGSGHFHLADDGTGHALITHS